MKVIHVFRKRQSGNIARNRLKLLLVSDKINCTPEMLDRMKDDMVSVISKYMEIDEDRIDIRIVKTGDSVVNHRLEPALYANIPIRDLTNKGIY